MNCALIAGGESHSLVATNTGQVYTFGRNSDGQLGLADFVDRQKPSLVSSIAGNVVKIAAGAKHSLVLSDLGELFATGSHHRGQLGLGDGIQKVNKFQEGMDKTERNEKQKPILICFFFCFFFSIF